MPGSYSEDLRRKIVAAHRRGRNQAQIAQDFGVSTGFVSTLLKQWRETGSLTPRPRGGGRRPSLDAEGLKVLAELVRADPDATLAELRSGVAEKLSVAMSTTAMWRALEKLAVPRKKSRSTPQSATRSA